MVDLRNALKMSFKKPSITTALKRRLLGFGQVASDKLQGTLLRGGGGRGLQPMTGICSVI